MARIKRRGVEEWREVIGRHPDSGLSIAAFCKREGICEPSFYSWRSRLAASAGVPMMVRQPLPITPGFVELGGLRSQDAGASRLDLRLDLGGGMVLRLTRS